MQLGMIGLGRMGANMVRRLLKSGHDCVVFDRSAKAVEDLVKEKATGATALGDFVKKLAKPRAIWLMVPAAVVDDTIAVSDERYMIASTIATGNDRLFRPPRKSASPHSTDEPSPNAIAAMSS